MIFGGPLQLFHAMSRSQMSYVPVMCQFPPKIGSSAVSSFSYIGLPGLPRNMQVTHIAHIITYERIMLAAPQGNLLGCLSCLSLGTKHDKMDQVGSQCTTKNSDYESQVFPIPF